GGVQDGAAADPGPVAEVAYGLADAGFPVRRVERHLDRVIPLLQQDLEVGGCMLRLDAAKDRHQRQPEWQECRVHGQPPRAWRATGAAAAGQARYRLKAVSVGDRQGVGGEECPMHVTDIAWRQ